jgi:hypothetical protein
MDFICHPVFQKENISDSTSVSFLRRKVVEAHTVAITKLVWKLRTLTQPDSIIPTSKNICSLGNTLIASLREDVFERGRKCKVVHAPLTNLPLHTITQTASKKCDHVVTAVQK